MKSIGMAFLTHVNLGNHNAGEGGSQLSNLKKYGNKPYISGQAYRHAIKDSLKSITTDGVDCTPQNACGEISECKLCDLFGYMNTDLDPSEDEPLPKRISPLRVTPLLGQYEMPVTTDMITQYAVGGSVKKSEENGNADSENQDQENKIAYREMEENVFKGALTIDINAIGQREIEDVDPDKEYDEQYQRELKNEISDEKRKNRVKELLESIQNTTQLAGQARHMADFMPDLMVASVQPVYNQRITNALHINQETGEIDILAFESVLKDIINMDADVWVAGTHNPEVISNWGEVIEKSENIDGVNVVDTVTDCYASLIEEVEGL